ncbi:hypothetical protein [Arthrobacter sp. Z4-13]
MNFWDMTYFTETASVPEVFLAVLSAALLVFWGLVTWFYRRKGESPLRKDAPKLALYAAKVFPWMLGMICLLCTVWAFTPGNLW